MTHLVQQEKFLTLDIQVEEAVSELTNYDEWVGKAEELALKYHEYEEILEFLEASKDDALEALRDEIDLRLGMWRSLKEWSKV